jgi:uracil-xanthine permease
MSGVGTLLFFLVVGGRVPSYLGSSFAFIGPVIAVTAYSGKGGNPNIGVALGGIIACGLLYTVIGIVVHMTREVRHKVYEGDGISVSEIETGASVHWIEKIMPPVVTGAVVAVIGLNLAPIAAKGAMGGTAFEGLVALGTVIVIALIAVFTTGMLRRLLILVGLVIAYNVYLVLANGMGLGKPIDFSRVAAAPWLGMPAFAAPHFDWRAVFMIAPVALILVAENLGHLRAVAAITERDMDPFVGRAFIGDGLATMLAGFTGGTGVTTYAENIGVMAVTRIYSTLVFFVAALFAVFLGFSPKFGALIQTIPAPVLGGVSIVVFGLITAVGARIWVQNQVDFDDNRNLVVVAVTLILGAGDFTLRIGEFALGGIGTATFGAILLYWILGRGDSREP